MKIQAIPIVGGLIAMAIFAPLTLAASDLPSRTSMPVGTGEEDECDANAILGDAGVRADETWDQFYALDDIYELNLAVPIDVRGLHEEVSRTRAKCYLGFTSNLQRRRLRSAVSEWQVVDPLTGNFDGVVDVTLELERSLQERSERHSTLHYGCVLEVEQEGTRLDGEAEGLVSYLRKKDHSPRVAGTPQPPPYDWYQIPDWDDVGRWPLRGVGGGLDGYVLAPGFVKSLGEAICSIVDQHSHLD